MVWIITCPKCNREGTADDFDMEECDECMCHDCMTCFIADLDCSKDDEP